MASTPAIKSLSQEASTIVQPPELLAPAGNWECAKAAVANGADAIYFGLNQGFNARARATNFAFEELSELLSFLHGHHVRGYVTLNTLGFTEELDAISRVIEKLARAGTDAILVQDLGVAKLAKSIAPHLEIHASTQMTLTSAETIHVAQELGLARVVLARELSLDEIRKITNKSELPVEVFVHGALCVAYSGQCLTSESLGGRSANRGQCAQACRLPYELTCDGEDVETGLQQYLLSPQDLAAFKLVPELIEANVCSLKIEGRLKTPEYVANMVRHYRNAIDEAMLGKPHVFSEEEIEEMELSFSRGFSTGWLKGCDHKELVPGITSAKQGVEVGTVVGVSGNRIKIEAHRPLKAGDGLVFAGDRLTGDEQGGRIYSLTQLSKSKDGHHSKQLLEITISRQDFDFSGLYNGQAVWKNDDPQLTKRLRKTFAGSLSGRSIPIELEVSAKVGSGLRVVGHVRNLGSFSVEHEQALEVANKHPATEELFRLQLSRLGGTGFHLETLTAKISGGPMVPLSLLGKLRRQIVESSRDICRQARNDSAQDINSNALEELRAGLAPKRELDGVATRANEESHCQLVVMCRTLEQLQLVSEKLELEVEIYADFQDPREYRQATEIANQNGRSLFLATPRIQKPAEMGLFRSMLKHASAGYLVRNLSGLRFFGEQNRTCRADFSLNAANELTVDWLLEQGAELVTTAYDLNREQVLSLVKSSCAKKLEVVIHQHMPMFHMEHCVFCAMLSPGTNKTNCGRPCDRHEVKLRDRIGVEHPLKADIGCRNTLFNATAQSGAEVVSNLAEAGVRYFRVELLEQKQFAEIETVCRLYDKLLKEKISGGEVWRQLRAVNCLGVTRGTLDEQRNPLAII